MTLSRMGWRTGEPGPGTLLALFGSPDLRGLEKGDTSLDHSDSIFN